MKRIEKVAFDPPSDPLFRDAQLAFDVELPVIGIPVRFESNSRQVIDAVNGSFGAWSSLKSHPELLASDSARVRLIVHEGEEGPEQHAEVRYRCPSPDRVLLATRGSFGVAEAGKGPDRLEAYAFVTPRLVADTAHFQYSFVEALTLVLLTGRDRHPVHAATLARDGAALLLVGPTFAGKSTLSYAAGLSGVSVLGEDVAYVQLREEFRIWAMPGRFHLPSDAANHFPQLSGHAATLQANGKEKIAVELPTGGREDLIPVARRARVCLLSPGAAVARIESADRSEIRAALLDRLEPGFDVYPEMAPRAADALAGEGGWRLHVSKDPHESIPLIRRMLDDVDRSSA